MRFEFMALWVLLGTCGLHWITVCLLIRWVRATEKPLVWNLLGLAVSLLAIQSTYTLYVQLIEVSSPGLNLINEVLGLLVAGLMLGGIMLLSPFLRMVQRNKELLAVIDERNVIIHQFHERIARSLRQVQIAMEVGKPINFIIEQVAELSNMLQIFLEDLKAGVLLGKKFEVALKTLVDDLNQQGSFPISVEFDSSLEDHISHEQGIELLHILREAIHNSVQYSQAKKGQVLVRMTDTQIVLEVSDNGKGFEVDLVGAQGHGIGNMVSRAKQIGARLKVHSQPHKGVAVIIELPMKGQSSNGTYSVSTSTPAKNVGQKVSVG